ncbi:helix-turn-helix transcriptional regulator [Mucilaginibacter arboris]|uniref:WYL domain-containing protein n=1 Tax=Mucilaginibacter arboris TaxID=2682090 RepID=A0A7K1SVB7_9SPHI|nr:WYL domain-containing protein [Mucilaginibacter arboris]MVN21265.1 WYL domain-containing protein [Mucilaginibacter arboris]
MSNKEMLLRYSAIIRRLEKSPATLKEIESDLEKESKLHGVDLKVSKKTFKRDLDAINLLYKRSIQFNFSKKKYEIDKVKNELFSDRLLEAFDTYNALNINAALSEHLDFEKQKPLGLENFHGLLHAIKNRLQVNLNYQTFWHEERSLRKTNPYFLKEFKNRWYLIAKDLKDNTIKTYGLDRITGIEITKKKFTYPINQNPKEKFQHSFGIIGSIDGSVPEKVILSFTVQQGKYVKTLSLHQSQEILINNEKELRIQLKVYIAFDFIKELLSYGDGVKVIEPASLIDVVKEAHRRAFKLY